MRLFRATFLIQGNPPLLAPDLDSRLDSPRAALCARFTDECRIPWQEIPKPNKAKAKVVGGARKKPTVQATTQAEGKENAQGKNANGKAPAKVQAASALLQPIRAAVKLACTHSRQLKLIASSSS